MDEINPRDLSRANVNQFEVDEINALPVYMAVDMKLSKLPDLLYELANSELSIDRLNPILPHRPRRDL